MSRIYGIDTGSLKVDIAEQYKTCPEIELFWTIDLAGGRLWRIRHDSADGRLRMTAELMNDMQELQYVIEYLAYQSNRFGTNIPEPKEGEHVVRTDEYWKWFRWWKKYIEKLSDKDISDIDVCLNTKVGIEKYRPEGDWRNESI
jgi:hypothetical protein